MSLGNRRQAPKAGGLSEVAALIGRSREADGASDAAAAALLAAVTQALGVLAPIRAHFDRLGATPLGTSDAQPLHFALDGLWMSEVLGISPLAAEERKAVPPGARGALRRRRAQGLTGLAAADVSRLRRANLGRLTVNRLMTMLARLGQEVEVTVSDRPTRPDLAAP